jgi:hypothetical protein
LCRKLLWWRHTNQQQQWQPIKILHQKALGTPSGSLLYLVVNKEVEQGPDIVTRKTRVPTSLNLNKLGKAAVLYLALLSSVARAMPNSACH